MDLSVGQIVYLLTRKSVNSKVYPALVCEEIQKKSLLGRTVNYVIRLPTEDQREIQVDNIDAEIFESIGDAREEMFKRAKNNINQLLEVAEKMSEIFGEEFKESHNNSENSGPEDDSYASVDLGDGNVARINMGEIDKISGVQKV